MISKLLLEAIHSHILKNKIIDRKIEDNPNRMYRNYRNKNCHLQIQIHTLVRTKNNNRPR